MNPSRMLRGPLAWGVLLAFLAVIGGVFIWDLATQQAENRIRSEQSTQRHIEYAEDRIDDKCLSLEPIPMRDCIHEEIESAHDHDRANQDLKAQEDMAFFTKVMGYAAGLGLALGIVSIWVIFATLREMGNTNRIMREEQRPWLVIDEPSTPFGTLARMYRSFPSRNLALMVTNKGKIPAKAAIATYVTFSHDTMTAEEVIDIMEASFFEAFEYSNLDTSTIFQGEKAHLRIKAMPKGKRVLGCGKEWSLMVICLYFWEEDVKWVWKVIDTKHPPQDVMKQPE